MPNLVYINENTEIRVEEGVTPRTFKRGAREGTVKFYRVRGDGSARHIPYLAPGTTQRDQAEMVQSAIKKGFSVAELADQLEISQPTIRRLVERLALSKALEKYRSADVAQLLADADPE